MNPAGRTLDLDLLLKRLGAFPVMGLAHAGSPEMHIRWAREGPKKRDVHLRGHKTAIDTLVTYEVEHKKALLQVYDEYVDQLLESRADGRPNKHSALRDFLIFAEQQLLQLVGRLEVRDARKRAAQIFGLTCDTRFARTRRPSIDQVKWAEERTIARFKLLQKWRGDGLLGAAWLKGVYVLGFYISELNGAPLDPETFHADAACLVALCRTLDAAERLDRIEKSAARKAEKRRPRPPREAVPDMSVN
jgi:hypothetical protein